MSTAVRSTIDLSNLQEMIDSTHRTGVSNTLRKGQAQYFTPDWFAKAMKLLLPSEYAASVAVFDPQRGAGHLLGAFHTGTAFSVELDRRLVPPLKSSNGVAANHITGNCVEVWSLLDEFFPDLTFRCQVANPPFGLRWSTPDGSAEDSTVMTWRNLLARAGEGGTGYMIANRGTIERFELHKEPRAYLYQTFPSGIFEASVEVGVLHFHGGHHSGPVKVEHTSAEFETVEAVCAGIDVPDYSVYGTDIVTLTEAFEYLRRLIAEAKEQRPPFNIYLDSVGYLRTYLSIRHELTKKLTVAQVKRLAMIDKCHPMTLTTERDTRLLMIELVECGTYTVQPEAAAAIAKAVKEMTEIACPIMPITDFQRTAYADENEAVEAKFPDVDANAMLRGGSRPAKREDGKGTAIWIPGKSFEVGSEAGISLTIGKRYPITTGTYEFVNEFTRLKLHMAGSSSYTENHQMTLSGQDRFIGFTDDNGIKHQFRSRPDFTKIKAPFEHSDELLWQLFTKPEVQTVAERYPEEVAKNLAVMEACELLGGFDYYAGQRDFYSRVAVRDYALVGAATGTGKTLGAITLVALKAPRRALIVAPQGTTKGGRDDDEDAIADVQASQWITELSRFAPGLQVFELFSEADYDRIVSLNGGELPHGVYVTYYEAMFSNGGRESYNERAKFSDRDIARLMGVPDPNPLHMTGTRGWCEGIGQEKHGIRCIVQPVLATKIGHLFDFVAFDEAHKFCHLSAQVTQMIVRLQPKYRYALTATPIPNLVTDIFPLMGWLCVPGWYRGGIRNAAWPFARDDGYRFSTTFLSTERDLTQERMNKAADENWKGKVERVSPVICSPARLLKIITPTMAYISKEACNPNKPKVTVHDVRVPMGAQQAKLYAHYMNRANVPGKNAMVKAATQVTVLRDLCAAPATSQWNKFGQMRSNFNPKAAAILSLIRDIIARGEQVVVVGARLNQTNYIAGRLNDAGVPYARIDSTFTPDRHTQQANLFKQKRVPVMFMGIKCAQAHSFDQCPNEIVQSLEYSYGSFDQASGRIDRVTSKRPMNIYCVLHRNSIEEIMFDIVATKGDAATICLRGERMPRNYKSTDLGEVLAKNFETFQITKDQPDETDFEAASMEEIINSLRATWQARANLP